MYEVSGEDIKKAIGKVVACFCGSGTIVVRLLEVTEDGEYLIWERIDGPEKGEKFKSRWDKGTEKLRVYEEGEEVLPLLQ